MPNEPSEAARRLGALIGPFPAEAEGAYLAWLESAAGHMWAHPAASGALRTAATLGVDVALGVEVELRLHILAGVLHHRLSREEVAALLHHSALYAGVPRANAALRIARVAFDEIASGEHPGIQRRIPLEGQGSHPEPERGAARGGNGDRTALRARDVGAVIGPFPSEIEERHLAWVVACAGPIWADGRASQPLRSALTLGILTALGEHVELAAHVRRAVVGSHLTRSEVTELLHHCAGYAGVPRANAALRTARGVFEKLDSA
jgi:alkylhydroperoxidase/carboxymuconolactone decarboxylase family protein YurZ